MSSLKQSSSNTSSCTKNKNKLDFPEQHARIIERVWKTLSSTPAPSIPDSGSKEDSDQESDSESDDNETNLVSLKIKELKSKSKKAKKEKKSKTDKKPIKTQSIQKSPNKSKHRTKQLIDKRKQKDPKYAQNTKNLTKNSTKLRKGSKTRSLAKHMKNVPSREWKPDVVYNHIIPSERSTNDQNQSLPYEYRYEMQHEIQSEKKQLKNFFNNSQDYSNLEPKSVVFPRALGSGSSAKSNKDRVVYQGKKYPAETDYTRENSFTESTMTPYNPSIPSQNELILGKKTEDYPISGQIHQAELSKEPYLEKRMKMKSYEKLSLQSREKNRNQKFEEFSIGSSLPKMNRLGIRKNNRSNVRNICKPDQPFHEKSKSQRKAAPFLNSMAVQKADFQISGMIKGTNFKPDLSSDSNPRYEESRVLHMRHSRFKPRTQKKLISLNPYENNPQKKPGAKVGFYVFPFTNDEEKKPFSAKNIPNGLYSKYE